MIQYNIPHMLNKPTKEEYVDNVAYWKAWYANYRMFDSRSGVLWKELPSEEALIFCEYEVGLRNKRIIMGGDWYWIENGRIQGSLSLPEIGTWVNPPQNILTENLKKGIYILERDWIMLSDLVRDSKY